MKGKPMIMGETMESLLCDETSALRLDASFAELILESFKQAAVSFSTLLQRDMVVLRCKIKLMTGEQFIGQMEDRMEEGYFASVISIENRVNTSIVFLLTENEGRQLYAALHPDGPTIPVFEDMKDIIGELNNILGNTIVSGMANALKWEIHGSVPKNIFDLLGAILESLILQDEFANEEILCAEADIMDSANEAFKVRLMVMLKKTQMLELWGR